MGNWVLVSLASTTNSVTRILLMSSLLVLLVDRAGAQVYTEEGNRYYRIYGTDYFLKQGRLEEIQALEILKMVSRDYKTGEMRYYGEIWQSIDDIYAGGNYHGAIILMIFRNYLNRAFNDYHNKPMPAGSVWVIQNYASTGYGASKSPYSGEVRNYVEQQYSFYYSWRLRILQPCPFGNFYKNVSGEYRDWFKSSEDARAYASSQIPSRDALIESSTGRSADNVREALLHIERTVRPDDNIFVSGEYDEILLKILDQYVVTKSKWGDEIAQRLYKRLVNYLINYAYSVEGKKALIGKAADFGIVVDIDSIRSEDKIF